MDELYHWSSGACVLLYIWLLDARVFLKKKKNILFIFRLFSTANRVWKKRW